MDPFDRRSQHLADLYPTEHDALVAFTQSHARLIDLGWRHPIYFQHHTDPTAQIGSICLGEPRINYATGNIHPAAILWREMPVRRRDDGYAEAAVGFAARVGDDQRSGVDGVEAELAALFEGKDG